MKRLTIAISVAVLALPLCAQDKPKTDAAPVQQDSPLVAAAKAANSRRSTTKKSIVITNDNLVLVGGHMASTDNTDAIPAGAQVTTGEQSIQNSRAAAETKARRDALAAKAERMKKDPLGFMRENAPEPEATRMQTTQPVTAGTAQLPTAATAQPPSASTTQMNQGTTTQVTTAGTTQPEVVNTNKPPER